MNKSNFYKRTRKKGAVYIFIVFVLTITTVAIAVGFTTPNIREFKNAVRDNLSNNAYLLAETGNEDAFYRLKNGMNVPAEIVITLNNAVSTTSVTTVGSDTEIVSSSAIENHTRKSKLELRDDGVTLGGIDYAAHVGSWGIEMSNNTDVIGVAPAVGEIYANGSVRGAANVTVTGDIFSASASTIDDSASSTSCTSDQIVGKTNPVVDHAQSFIASTTAEAISAVDIFIKKNGNPSSKTIRLVADNGGVPDTTTITSGTLDSGKVTSVYSWLRTYFDSPVVLTGGNTYWIVVDTSRHNNKYYRWCKDSSGPYSGGVAMSTQNFSSPSWSAVTGDLTFRTVYGEGVSSIEDVQTVQGDAHADTIDNTNVLGDAYYVTFTGGSLSGTPYSGSPTPDVIPMPLTDTMINAWIADAESGGTISGDCPGSPGCSWTMGPKKIDGDLNLNEDTLTLTGTLYVTGHVDSDNNVVVECDTSYGAESCVLISDGFMAYRNNTDLRGSGTSGSFILLITRKADCLLTSGSNCASGNSGLHLSNNGITGGVFFAQDSVALLENNASVSSVIAKGVKLDNNAQLIYDQDLRDLDIGAGSGGGGGGGGWLVEDWREVE